MLSQNKPRLLLVAGTRPECLKLASLVNVLHNRNDCTLLLLNSGQHGHMVRRTFAHLGITCDLALGQLIPQSLSHAVRTLRERIRAMALEQHVDLMVSQGDTVTAYATALAARDLTLPLAHIEAGLRTEHPWRPFPEELFRRRIAACATLNFAPTLAAEQNLVREGIAASRVYRVGNTVIDLLREQLQKEQSPHLMFLPDTTDIITLTLHRRENYGRGLDIVCTGVLELLRNHPNLGLVCPLHPNPTVSERIRYHLRAHPRIVLVEALNYRDFIALLQRSRLVITDSGGIQEEAPYLGLPVLLVRENTERQESVALGCVHLVPLHRDRIVAQTARMLATTTPLVRQNFDADAPYGDGRSGARIAAAVLHYLHASISAVKAAPTMAMA